MKTSWIITIIIVLIAIIAFVVYIYPKMQQTEPVTSEGHKVEIKDFSFNPKNLQIKAGVTVEWTNKDSVAHKIKFDSGEESPTMQSGETYEKLFTKNGTYSYICSIHPSMKGTIIVS